MRLGILKTSRLVKTRPLFNSQMDQKSQQKHLQIQVVDFVVTSLSLMNLDLLTKR